MSDNIYSNGTYLVNNPDWHKYDSEWKSKQILTILNKNNNKPNAIAEVGCGAGEILRYLSKALPYATLDGYDLSSIAIEMCKSKENDRLKYHNKDIADSGKRYDCLLLIDVIEHIEEYFSFLRKMSAFTDTIIIHVPLEFNAQMITRNIPLQRVRTELGHLHYFTKDMFLSILSETGYIVDDYFYTGSSISVQSTSYKAKLLRPVRRLLFRLLPDICVRLLGGYSLLVMAKTKDCKEVTIESIVSA